MSQIFGDLFKNFCCKRKAVAAMHICNSFEIGMTLKCGGLAKICQTAKSKSPPNKPPMPIYGIASIARLLLINIYVIK